MEHINVIINQHQFNLEVPVTKEEYTQGLMFRRTLPERHGMLFIFDPQGKPQAMWMKNTYLSLDMLFVGPDSKIACILEHTQPLSLTLLSCDAPVSRVIELNAGEVKKYHLEQGMNIPEHQG
jgi:uncharacterized membrane protein (UPF0127 family)